jgi:hypothetical protein
MPIDTSTVFLLGIKELLHHKNHTTNSQHNANPSSNKKRKAQTSLQSNLFFLFERKEGADRLIKTKRFFRAQRKPIK